MSTFIIAAIAGDRNLLPAFREPFCEKHTPKHLARIGAAHPQLENVCATCGSRIVRASVCDPWRAR